MHSSPTVPLQHLSEVKVWTLTLLFQHVNNIFSYAGVFGITVLLHHLISPSISCWTDGLIFIFTSGTFWYKVGVIIVTVCSFPDHVAAKPAQIITSPPPCSGVGMRCLWWVSFWGVFYISEHYTVKWWITICLEKAYPVTVASLRSWQWCRYTSECFRSPNVKCSALVEIVTLLKII